MLAQGELFMKAYGVNVRARRAPPLAASRVVLVTGFEHDGVDVQFVRGREGVLCMRLSSRKVQGGPIESFETLEERGVPFARVTFHNATGSRHF